MHDDLNALSVFAVISEEASLRAAADRLGVTRSAVSQSLRRLEADLGVSLVRRTTRSMSLTEEGERLRGEIAPAIADMRAALDGVRAHRSAVRGQLRLAVSSIAESVLSGPLLAGFCDACPDVQLDVLVTDEEFDIVAQGFDAGVRLGEVIEQDMIAVPVSGDQRQVAVAAPVYLERAGTPLHPRELAAHRCIGWRPAPRAAPYRWEFAEDERDFTVSVEPEVTTNDMRLMVQLARAGAGISFGMEDTFHEDLERGTLVSVLDAFCPPFPGFFLYYPSRRDMPMRLRAFVDHILRYRRERA
ncbi:LysR family transcriptional regulator [Aureimonas phyllosphaerae]|uniref:DNA-binding transcriptional LysR family regulator n=1 Tax=Aureimonas phyllosphaerae TaxID=1166078 RepID=A0A7W6BLI4_9HYPH|nr:LysR family transcriptional regulator [Aureimonas phyllosphaerae]MBB3934208.1 DNA-binding transcriptional LysR family regulator [Aureimonas phyllosphaerae]MBB3958576.1 DNA-binding transcriptional LysR family regulator [Aureimonas phyllosphaerae]SFE99108.1 transcriptional regulator, LysR family [Aureimonas phyllosphaerae]